MNITRCDPFTGKTNTLDLKVTEEQWKNYTERGWKVQQAFPHLSADDRQFIMTGIMPDSWAEAFPKKESEGCWCGGISVNHRTGDHRMQVKELIEAPPTGLRVWNSVKTRRGTVTETMPNGQTKIVWDETGIEYLWWWTDIEFEIVEGDSDD